MTSAAVSWQRITLLMLTQTTLPTINAALNASSFLLLMAGFALIRAKKVTAHKWCMTAAFGVSTAFLVSYVYYHLTADAVKFGGQGWVRPVYFFILITHIVLAATVPPLAARTLYLGWRGRIASHRRIARVTLPIWSYVSVTGVVVYVFLYMLYGVPATQ